MQEFIPMASEFAKNHSILVIAWVALFITVVYQLIQGLTSKVKSIDNAQATSLMNNEDAVVIDLRSMDEFQQGHIINSVNLVPSEIKNHNLGKIEHHKETPVILVDASGLTANASASILVKQGFSKVYLLKDGITGWRTANLPLVRKHK